MIKVKMVKGTVTFFHDRKGYGFIESEEEDEDIFIHHSELPSDTELKEGLELEFEIEQGDEGPRATNVEILQ